MSTTPAILKTLIGPAQRAALWAALEGEERGHFADIVARLVATWQAMPATYATESQCRAAIAHLHYFLGGADWWIIEKDSAPDSDGQIQAFGIADLGMGPELGYISIPELLEVGTEQANIFRIPSPSAARSGMEAYAPGLGLDSRKGAWLLCKNGTECAARPDDRFTPFGKSHPSRLIPSISNRTANYAIRTVWEGRSARGVPIAEQ